MNDLPLRTRWLFDAGGLQLLSTLLKHSGSVCPNVYEYAIRSLMIPLETRQPHQTGTTTAVMPAILQPGKVEYDR
jgi:hypothetical protein